MAIFPVYLNKILAEQSLKIEWGIFHWQTNALSLWGYCVSFSIFISLIIILFLGSWADENKKRKPLLLFFNLGGALATMALALFDDWRLLLLCFSIANIGFSLGNVFNNSILSSVAKEQDWDRLSLKAYAWGYLSSGLTLLVSLALILRPEWFGLKNSLEATKLSFVFAGGWWFVLCLPSYFFIEELKSSLRSGFGRLQSLLKTLRSLLQNKSLLLFIIAYALMNDGVWTVVTMSSVFAKQELALDQNAILSTFLVIQFVGWPATLGMIWLAKRIGAKKSLQASLVIWMMLLIYAYWIETSTQFLALGVGVALVLGVSQALPRSVYARLIPARQQAEYFAVYALSGKAASIVGPAYFALMMDFTGSARFSILSLILFFGGALLLLSRLDLSPKPKPSFD